MGVIPVKVPIILTREDVLRLSTVNGGQACWRDKQIASTLKYKSGVELSWTWKHSYLFLHPIYSAE